MTSESRKPAMQWALRALGRRMHTSHELRTALSRRGFDEDVIRSVLGELEADGYIDDLNFARVWVQSRSANMLHGPMRLLKDLRQKGVTEAMARSVLRETLSGEEEAALALKAAARKRRTIETTGIRGKSALYRYLRSRGFTSQAINQVLAEFTFEEDPS